MDVSVVVPETTKPLVIEKLRSLGAEVTIHGANWNLADALARQWVDEAKEKGVSAVYVRCVQYATHIIASTLLGLCH
jgi:threonine dehydratase